MTEPAKRMLCGHHPPNPDCPVCQRRNPEMHIHLWRTCEKCGLGYRVREGHTCKKEESKNE